MAFSVLGLKEFPNFLSGLRHHPLYHSMGPYPYSLLTTADVPQFSPWWVQLLLTVICFSSKLSNCFNKNNSEFKLSSYIFLNLPYPNFNKISLSCNYQLIYFLYSKLNKISLSSNHQLIYFQAYLIII